MSGILKEEKENNERGTEREGPQSSKAFGCYPLGQWDVLATLYCYDEPWHRQGHRQRHGHTAPSWWEGMAEMPWEGRGTWWKHLRRITSDHNLQGLPLATCLCSEALYPKCSIVSLNSTTQASKHKNPRKDFTFKSSQGLAMIRDTAMTIIAMNFCDLSPG